MKSAAIALLASVFATAVTQAALPVQTTFVDAKPVQTWSLKELDASLPADWTGYEFLVLEFKASSSQRFDLGLETPQGRIAKRIGPFAGVWVRAAIPLRFYRQPAGDGVDMAATYNQPRNSYWINIHTSAHGPLTNVTGLSVSMDRPVGS
ncbi:MAG TPA: hypothetical protein VI136_19755, partial [Verrucomicrobiae bacterium]